MLLAAVLAIGLAGQEPALFQSNVSLIRAEVVVIYGNRLVTGLRQEDFRLFDNQQEQPVLHFSEDQEPLDILLVFDVSASMRPSIERIAAAAEQAFRQLQADDRVAVMKFARQPLLLLPLTGDLHEAGRVVREDVLHGKISGGTRLLRAAQAAATQLRSGPRDRRRAVIMITDNIGAGSVNTKTVTRAYWEADAVLNGVLIPPSKFQTALKWTRRITSPYLAVFEERIQAVVTGTGGELIRGEDPAAAFEEMIGRLRRRYCLYYRQPEGKPGEERTIRVELTAEARERMPNALVRARRGYILPKTESPNQLE